MRHWKSPARIPSISWDRARAGLRFRPMRAGSPRRTSVAVMTGGFPAWKEAGGEVSEEAVADEATAALMESFYSRLAEGQSRAEALRGARLELLESEPWSHPFFWGSFVLAGDWRPLP